MDDRYSQILKDIAVGILIWLILVTFVGQSRIVPTGSMVPTILPGDRIFTEKLSVRLGRLGRGDIVVFDPPFESSDPYIKRIIGLPGETVEVTDGHVKINGIALNEPYINERPAYRLAPTVVPDHHYFVLGDNRNQSKDGHVWGMLPDQNVTARALFAYWPVSRFGSLAH